MLSHGFSSLGASSPYWGLYTKPRVPRGVHVESRHFTWILPGLQVLLGLEGFDNLAGNPSQTTPGAHLEHTWNSRYFPCTLPGMASTPGNWTGQGLGGVQVGSLCEHFLTIYRFCVTHLLIDFALWHFSDYCAMLWLCCDHYLWLCDSALWLFCDSVLWFWCDYLCDSVTLWLCSVTLWLFSVTFLWLCSVILVWLLSVTLWLCSVTLLGLALWFWCD